MLVSLRRFQQRHPRLVGIGLAGVVTAIVVVALWGQREEFATALRKAPLWLLGCAVLLQIVALLTRTDHPSGSDRLARSYGLLGIPAGNIRAHALELPPKGTGGSENPYHTANMIDPRYAGDFSTFLRR